MNEVNFNPRSAHKLAKISLALQSNVVWLGSSHSHVLPLDWLSIF